MQSGWKRAIVVGASSGIGEEMACQLAAQGVRVALCARRASELERVRARIASAGGDPIVRVHDVRQVESTEALFNELCAELGGLDLIVYSAGIMPRIGDNEYNLETDRLMIETNLLGAIAWLNLAAIRFERASAGTIVGIGSVAGDRGRRGLPVYAASKAGLDTYLEALRNRLSRRGVRIVTIKPGPVDTDLTRGLEKLPLLISAPRAAELSLRAARRGGIAYVPGTWRYLMALIRWMPSPIFRYLNV